MIEKHTPGPWMFDGSVSVEAGGQLVSLVYSTVRHDGFGTNLVANALLIAAAPDLFEALSTLERVSGSACSYDDPARVAARLAIAKAIGGEA